MKKLFTVFLSILIIVTTISCTKTTPQFNNQLNMQDTIECVDVSFTVSPSIIKINNDNSIFNVSGTTSELIDWLNSIDNGEDIIYVSYTKNNNEPTYILTKKYHYYTGDRNYTWIISNNMVKQGIYYLSSFSN